MVGWREDLMQTRHQTSHAETGCTCGWRTLVFVRFFAGLGVAASLSTSTRHLDLRHGEGPLSYLVLTAPISYS